MVDIPSIGSPLSEPLNPMSDQPMPGIPKGRPLVTDQPEAAPDASVAAPQPQAQQEPDSSIADDPQRAPASEAPQLSDDLPLGQKKLNALKDNNYTSQDIADWKANASEKLRAKGYDDTDISDYFGDPPPVKPTPFVTPNTQIGEMVKANYQVYNAKQGAGQGPAKQTEAHSTLEAFEAGLQFSTAGLGIRGKMPDMVLPEHAERAFQIASQIGTMAGDMPAMLAGGFLGGSAGALGGGVAGTSVVPGVGTFAGAAMGAAVGTGAGAFALPAALRKMMVDHYEIGDITTAREFSNRVMAATWEATKGALTGAATATLGGVAGFAAGTVAGTAAATTAKFGADLATMTTVGAALEGHLPSKDDFINGAVVIGGLHGTGTITSKLMNIHAATGLAPHEIVEKAAGDVQFKQELLSDNPKLPVEAQPTRIETVHPAVEEGKPPEMPEHKLVPADTPEAVNPPDMRDIFHGTNTEFDKFDFDRGGGMVHFGENEKDVQKYALDTGSAGRASLPDDQIKVIDGNEELHFDKDAGGWIPKDWKEGEDVITHKDLAAGRENGDLSIEAANPRVVKSSIDMSKVIDTSTREGLQKFVDTVEPTNKRIRQLIKVAKEELAGVPGSKFSGDFWSLTKLAKGDEINASLKELTEQLKAKGFEGIRFNDDSHKTIAAFDNFEKHVEAQDTSPKDEATGLTDEEAQAKIRSKIGTTEKPADQTWSEWRKEQYQKHIDYLDPVKEFENLARKQGTDISKTDSAYVAGRILAASADKVQSFLTDGTRDAKTGEINGESIHTIINDLPKVDGVPDVKSFEDYAVAKRAIELSDRDITPYKGFNRAEAMQVVRSLGPEYEELNQRRVAFENRALEYAKDKGLLSDDSLERIKAANEQHISFKRVFDPDEFTGKTEAGKPLKEIKGSERQIEDPLLQTMKNVEALIKRADINDVRNKFVDNMSKAELIATPEIEDASEMALRKVAQPDGVLRDNQIAVYKNGFREVYEGSPGLVDSLKRMDGDNTAVEAYSKLLSGFTKALRIGTTANPMFGFRHFWRSQLTSYVYSETGMKPFEGLLSIPEMIGGESEAYKNWKFDGGASSTFTNIDENYFKNNVFEMDKKFPFINKAWNVVKSIPEASEAWIKLTDGAARFTEYKRSIEQGASRTEAAFNSREVVTDYQKVGLVKSAMRTNIAFLGAHINSMDRFQQAFREDFTGTSAKYLASATLPSLLLWAAQKDNDNINDLPFWQRALYNNIDTSFGKSKDGYILRLPVQWTGGLIFGSLPVAALNAFKHDNPSEAERMAVEIAKSVLPEFIPNAFGPVLDQYANKNRFSGRDLVTHSKEDLLPELKYERWTSETAKQIGKIIGYVPLVRDIGTDKAPLVAPVIIENYIKGWTGTLGGWALRISDAGLRQAGIGDQQAHSADTIADNPIVKEFLTRYPLERGQSEQDFYDNMAKTTQQLHSIKSFAKLGDVDSAMALHSAHPDLEMNMKSVAEGLKVQNQLIQNTVSDPKMSPTDKRQLIDTILYRKNEALKAANKMMSDFKKNVTKEPQEAMTASPQSAGGQ